MSAARATAVKRLHFGAGKTPVRRPPSLQPGQALRTLRRQHAEDYDGAVVRARLMSWWPLVVDGGPYSSAAMWIWVVRA